MIEAVARRGYAAHDRRPRDRARRRLQARLLRAVRQQGGVLPGDLRRASSRALAGSRSTPGSASAAGRAACTPRARRCSATSPRAPARAAAGARRRARRRAARAPRACALAALRLRAARRCRCSALAPDGARMPRRSTARAIVGGMRHLAFMRLLRGAASASSTLLADELARLDRGLPLAGRARPADARRTPRRAHAPAPREPGPRSSPATTRARARSARPCGSAREEGFASRERRARSPQLAGISAEALHRCSRASEACFLAAARQSFVAEALDAVARGASGEARRGRAAVHRAVRRAARRTWTRGATLMRVAFVDVFALGAGGARADDAARSKSCRLRSRAGAPRAAARARDRARGDRRCGVGASSAAARARAPRAAAGARGPPHVPRARALPRPAAAAEEIRAVRAPRPGLSPELRRAPRRVWHRGRR